MLTVIVVGAIALFVGFLIKVFVYKQNPTKSLYGDSAPSITPDDERPSTQADVDTLRRSKQSNDAPQALSASTCVLGAAGITIFLFVALFILGQEEAAVGVAAPAALISYITLRRGFSFFSR